MDKITKLTKRVLAITAFSMLLAPLGYSQSITGFTLVDADSDVDLFSLNQGDTINVQDLPSNLNIRANASGTVGSIFFFLNGIFERIENVAPYALGGDQSGNYAPVLFPLDDNAVKAVAYANSGGKGAVLDSASINLVFINQPSEILVADINFTNCPSTTLMVGDVIDLDVEIIPSNATNQTIAFTASDGTSVDFLSGEFTAQAHGQITVTATSFSDGCIFDQCVITILEPSIPINPYDTIQAEDFDSQSGTQPGGSGIAVGFINNGDFIQFEEVAFGRGPASGTVRASSNTSGGQIEFRTDSVNGPLLATADITNTGGWNTFQNFPIDVIDADSYANGTVFLGTQDLFLVFTGGGGFLFDIDEFIFVDSDVIIQDLNFTNCPTEPLFVGEMIDLDVEIIPTNTTNQVIAFTASDGTSVDFLTGEFTAQTPGEITVTATSFSDGSVSDQCVITILDTIPPVAPSDLSGVAIAQGLVNLTWIDNSNNEEFFEIEASYESGPWNLIGTVPSDSAFFQDSGLGAEWSGEYRVRAVNQFGSSPNSTSIYVSNFPVPPTNFRADSITKTSIFLAWDPPAYGNDYLIEFSANLDSGFQFFDALYFGYDGLEYGGFDSGQTYYFRMRTNFDGKPSKWTDTLEVTTLLDGQSISALILVDADSNQDLQELSNGDTLNLFYLPELNVRAETIPDSIGSVGFNFNGNADFATENIAPYALGGDTGGNYAPLVIPLGPNTITTTPYTFSNRGGVGGDSKSVSFYVINVDTVVIPPDTTALPEIAGELKKWHKVTLSFEGPVLSETSMSNPFTDYRLNVTFTNGSKTYVVPGFYAADGKAANTSATSGNIWQVHFAPDDIGTWTYSASFRTGTDIAISTNPTEGTSAWFDGQTGTFDISPTDKTGRDFRATGRLEYVGEHYLQFAETGEYFFKVGADAPENTFAYEDFDATPNKSGRRKSWAFHAADFDLFDAGDYTWGTIQGDSARANGRELLGAINYLAGEGMNVFSFLTFSLDGDDDNVYPHLQIVNDALSYSDVYHDRFDVSKLAQWEKILEYADKKGVYMHFKTQETENDQLMDDGQLGRERKLYYRELVARFGHHLALNWNLGEENDIWQELSDPNNNIVRSYAQYIRDIDPYNHNIVIHTYPGQQDEVYNPLLGLSSELTGASVQTGVGNVHRDVKKWVEESRISGKKWVVANDEQGGAQTGVTVDASYPDSQLPEPRNNSDNRDAVRDQVLWGTMLAGGAGVEYYYGYQTGCDDLDCQDHRTRQSKWDDAKVALDFFNTYLQSHVLQMTNNDGLTNDNSDYVFAEEGEIYVIYRASGGATDLNLTSQTGSFEVKWYDPRNGGALQDGSVITIAGGSLVSIGLPPSSTSNDWVALVTKKVSALSARLTEDSSQQSVLEIGYETIEFTIYPNPVENMLNIKSSSSQKTSAQIISIDGKKLLEKRGKEDFEMDLSALNKGIYFLEIQSEGQLKKVKILKE